MGRQLGRTVTPLALPVGAAVRAHSRPLVLGQAARLAPPAAQLAVDKLRDMRKVTGCQQTLVGAKLVSGERVHGVQVLLQRSGAFKQRRAPRIRAAACLGAAHSYRGCCAGLLCGRLPGAVGAALVASARVRHRCRIARKGGWLTATL